jgi:hypothetical protein
VYPGAPSIKTYRLIYVSSSLPITSHPGHYYSLALGAAVERSTAALVLALCPGGRARLAISFTMRITHVDKQMRNSVAQRADRSLV